MERDSQRDNWGINAPRNPRGSEVNDDGRSDYEAQLAAAGDRGTIFFTLFPILTGIVAGVLRVPFVGLLPWWAGALLLSLFFAIAHILVGSPQYRLFRMNEEASGTQPSVLGFLLLKWLTTAAIIIGLGYGIRAIRILF